MSISGRKNMPNILPRVIDCNPKFNVKSSCGNPVAFSFANNPRLTNVCVSAIIVRYISFEVVPYILFLKYSYYVIRDRMIGDLRSLTICSRNLLGRKIASGRKKAVIIWIESY